MSDRFPETYAQPGRTLTRLKKDRAYFEQLSRPALQAAQLRTCNEIANFRTEIQECEQLMADASEELALIESVLARS